MGDENLNKIPDVLYPIIKILRNESNGNFEYSLNPQTMFVTKRQNVYQYWRSAEKSNAGVALVTVSRFFRAF
ncbi:MAG: hypothetical protein L3J74_15775, partial [Bacteroidales bacterium]|nr:hypothetical protein [Bacteroidales bacterium]